jgi:hypothetical protein
MKYFGIRARVLSLAEPTVLVPPPGVGDPCGRLVKAASRRDRVGR